MTERDPRRRAKGEPWEVRRLRYLEGTGRTEAANELRAQIAQRQAAGELPHQSSVRPAAGGAS